MRCIAVPVVGGPTLAAAFLRDGSSIKIMHSASEDLVAFDVSEPLPLVDAFLLVTGIKMARRVEAYDPSTNPVLKLARRLLPLTDRYHGQKFWVRLDGRWVATPLFFVLVMVEAVGRVKAARADVNASGRAWPLIAPCRTNPSSAPQRPAIAAVIVMFRWPSLFMLSHQPARCLRWKS